MLNNDVISVTVSGSQERVKETLDELAKVFDESWRKEYKVPHYRDLYRGTVTLLPKNTQSSRED